MAEMQVKFLTTVVSARPKIVQEKGKGTQVVYEKITGREGEVMVIDGGWAEELIAIGHAVAAS